MQLGCHGDHARAGARVTLIARLRTALWYLYPMSIAIATACQVKRVLFTGFGTCLLSHWDDVVFPVTWALGMYFLVLPTSALLTRG